MIVGHQFLHARDRLGRAGSTRTAHELSQICDGRLHEQFLCVHEVADALLLFGPLDACPHRFCSGVARDKRSEQARGDSDGNSRVFSWKLL